MLLTEVIFAQLVLQAASQSFEVSPQRAPMRDAPNGALIGELHHGDEVQVLQAQGKWRYVHTASSEGHALEGWFMKKHLRRSSHYFHFYWRNRIQPYPLVYEIQGDC